MARQKEPWRPSTSQYPARDNAASAAAPPSSVPMSPRTHQQQPNYQQPYRQPQLPHQPPHHHQQQQPQPLPFLEVGRSPIPQLTTLAPAIFTEIGGDELTVPFTPPPNRLKRIESKLDKFGKHSKKVRENCLTLYRQECLRQIQNTYAWEKENPDRIFEGREPPAAASPEACRGLNILIDNMTAGFEKETGGLGPQRSVDELQRQVQMQMQTQTAPRVSRHPFSRQALVQDLERTINKGLVDLDSFNGHVEGIKQQYRTLYETEVTRDRELDFN